MGSRKGSCTFRPDREIEDYLAKLPSKEKSFWIRDALRRVIREEKLTEAGYQARYVYSPENAAASPVMVIPRHDLEAAAAYEEESATGFSLDKFK